MATFKPVRRKYLKEFRARSNLTQYAVAEKAGLAQSYYCRIEKGARGHLMNALNLIKLSEALEVNLEELVRAEAKYLSYLEDLKEKEME